jgi:antitoxin component of RelBE/YafQ-DinJ toxin-antitoxin module
MSLLTKVENKMASNDVVRAWIDGHIKEEATNVLAGMGLPVSDTKKPEALSEELREH